MPKFSFRGVRPTIIDALEHEINKLIPNNGYVHGQVLPDRVEATAQAYMEKHPELEIFKQNPQFAKMMNIAAAVHDLGKLDVANSILLKRGKLTNEEFAEIKKHPVYGAERLKNIFRNFKDFSKEDLKSWGPAYNQEIVDISMNLKQKELDSFGKLNNQIVENPSNVQNNQIISLDDIEI